MKYFKLISLFLLLSFFNQSVFSQKFINDRVKVQYIFTFGRMFNWENQKELDTFRIATFGKDTNMYHLLKGFSLLKKLHKKPVKIEHYFRLKSIKHPQILYLERSNNKDIRKLYRSISGKNILLVTDSLKGVNETMLNFLPIIIVRLEINQQNVEMEGFKVPPLLAAFSAKHKQNWEELFNLSEDSLDKAMELVENQRKTLKEQEKEITKKQEEISILSDTLQKQLMLVKQKEIELQKLSSEIENQKKDIVIKARIVDRQKRKINSQLEEMHRYEKKLSDKQKDLQMQTSILNKQRSEIDSQGKFIQSQKKQISNAFEQIQKQKLINYFAIVVAILLLFFVLFILYHYLNKRKANKILEFKNLHIRQQKEEIQSQRDEIESQRDEIQAQRDTVLVQKDEIEKVHEELRDSIFYAKRIQNALLPDTGLIADKFSEHFVLFKSKDIVSGDFYWCSHVEVDNSTVITVADCTGHGIPGGFMSMLGISLLREVVNKEYISHPGVILRKIRREIVKSLKQTLEQEATSLSRMKDGMDMALISINHETNELQFAGANNPLYIISRSELKIKSQEQVNDIRMFSQNNDLTLYEIKPDKMPIAIYERMDKFTTHKIHVNKGDQIYLFSDGFADQFGGDDNKKFKYKPFKQLLIDNADKSMTEQKDILEKIFNKWKGEYEQVDDVTIFGIKI